MDSRFHTSSVEKKGLSADGIGAESTDGVGVSVTPKSAPSPTGSKKGTSLDIPKKKVGQSTASSCKNPKELYFVCDKGHVVRREVGCHARFVRECPYCGYLWRKKTIKRYAKIISRMESPKFVGLTLRKGGLHKIDKLSSLVQRCRKYIRRKGYKIKSFVFCIEPPNHVHCVWDCGYIPQHKLCEIWHTVTGDSFIVDIRMVDRQRWRGAVTYITKYITKMSEEFIGLRGIHVIGSWGALQSKRMCMVCKKCGSYFHPLWDLDYVVKDYVDCKYVEIDYG